MKREKFMLVYEMLQPNGRKQYLEGIGPCGRFHQVLIDTRDKCIKDKLLTADGTITNNGMDAVLAERRFRIKRFVSWADQIFEDGNPTLAINYLDDIYNFTKWLEILVKKTELENRLKEVTDG
jgi:hypothetical protein